ncbi:MAG: transporter substrate-binding domain-containing protein [Bacilli bacterium]
MIISVLVLLLGCSNQKGDENTLVVGMECNYAPHNWLEATPNEFRVKVASNQYCEGYDVDIALLMAKDLNKQLVIKKLAWEALIPSLNNGEIDVIIAGMSPTKQRLKVIDFTNQYTKTSFGILVNKNSIYSNATTLADFSNAKITAQLGTAEASFIQQIDNVVALELIKDFSLMATALNAQQIDGFILDASTGAILVKNNPNLVFIDLSGAGGFIVNEDEVIVSMGVKKGNAKLKDDLNKALAQIDQQQRDKIKEDAINRHQ